jgi:hypothetical protein
VGDPFTLSVSITKNTMKGPSPSDFLFQVLVPAEHPLVLVANVEKVQETQELRRDKRQGSQGPLGNGVIPL